MKEEGSREGGVRSGGLASQILACVPSYLGQNFKLTHGPGPRARPVGGDPEYFSRFPRDSIAESGVRTTG